MRSRSAGFKASEPVFGVLEVDLPIPQADTGSREGWKPSAEMEVAVSTRASRVAYGLSLQAGLHLSHGDLVSALRTLANRLEAHGEALYSRGIGAVGELREDGLYLESSGDEAAVIPPLPTPKRRSHLASRATFPRTLLALGEMRLAQ